MTQFILIIGNPPENTLQKLGLVSISIHQSPDFLKKIANQLFIDDQLSLCWYPKSKNEKSVHDLFTDAAINLQEGWNVNETIIGSLLFAVLPISQEIIIWYANDFHDLDCLKEIPVFMNTINFESSKGSWKICLRFKK